jgi:glycine dehydrogenase subunit 1
MALMGPQGFVEMGEGILQRVAYAKAGLSTLKGVTIPFGTASYCDFLVNFDGTGKSVTEINKALLGYGIFGGKDVSHEFAVGQSALYSVTEVHEKEDIDKLVSSLAGICG